MTCVCNCECPQCLVEEKQRENSEKPGQRRVNKIVAKLRQVGNQCEAGGHKSRARMFRALAKEFEGKHYQ